MVSFRPKGAGAFVQGFAGGASEGIKSAVGLYQAQTQRDLSNTVLMSNMITQAQSAYNTDVANWRTEVDKRGWGNAGPMPTKPGILRMFEQKGQEPAAGTSSGEITGIAISKTGTPSSPTPDNLLSTGRPIADNTENPTVQSYNGLPKNKKMALQGDYDNFIKSGGNNFQDFNNKITKAYEDSKLDEGQITKFIELRSADKKLSDFVSRYKELKAKGVKNITGPGQYEGTRINIPKLGELETAGNVEKASEAAARAKSGTPTAFIGKIESLFRGKPSLEKNLLKGDYEQAINAYAALKAKGDKSSTESFKAVARTEFPSLAKDQEIFEAELLDTISDLSNEFNIIKDGYRGDKIIGDFEDVGSLTQKHLQPAPPTEETSGTKPVKNNLPADQIDFNNPDEVNDAIRTGRVTEQYAMTKVNEALDKGTQPTLATSPTPSIPPSTKGSATLEPLNKQIQNMIDAGAVIPDGMPSYEKNAENIPPDEYAAYQQGITNAPMGTPSMVAPDAPGMTESPMVDPLQRALELRQLLGLPGR